MFKTFEECLEMYKAEHLRYIKWRIVAVRKKYGTVDVEFCDYDENDKELSRGWNKWISAMQKVLDITKKEEEVIIDELMKKLEQ